MSAHKDRTAINSCGPDPHGGPKLTSITNLLLGAKNAEKKAITVAITICVTAYACPFYPQQAAISA